MNNIPIEQDSERQIRRLAAQRQLYGRAKTAFGWQLFLSGPIAVVLAFLAMAFPGIKGSVAAWGLFVTLCDVFWLTPLQKRLRATAATIQEQFDCDVLEMPWNDLKAGRKPDPELVLENATRYERRKKGLPPLEAWYSQSIGVLPLHIARLACQRSNCWWDSTQRRRYATLIIVIVVALFATFLALAMKGGLTLEDFVLQVAAPLAPALVLGIRQFGEQRDAAARLEKLKEHAERLWGAALAGMPAAEATVGSRTLQDEILESRRRSPLVFDTVFRHLRSSYQEQMDHGVAELVAEAGQQLGTAAKTN